MKKFGILVAAVMVAVCTDIAAADAAWVGSASSDFMNSANWNPVEVPAGNMTIENGSPYDPIYAYTGASYVGVSSLSVNSGGHLTVTAGELRPYGSSWFNGELTITGGSLNVRSNVYIGHGSDA